MQQLVPLERLCTVSYLGTIWKTFRWYTMEYRLTTLEKAFQLARSGNCPNFAYLMKKLKDERYDTVHIQGPTLKKQLSKLIEKTERS